jgi:RNA polymerase sigma factor (TIGR02999 family)
MRRERPDHTLQPTALVNELYLHLLQRPDLNWADREHFLLSASRAMHNLLIDHARARGTLKRGGGWARVDLDEPGETAAGLDMLELAELLSVLETKEPRMADVVRLKFYVGLSVVEIAEALGIDERSVKRDWALARQWLRGHLENQ